MNNEKFTITVSAGMQIASVEQIDNTVVVLVEGIKAEPLKWQPKEGEEVYNVLFDVRANQFYIYPFQWSTQCTLSDCMKQSMGKAQKLCIKLNAALNEK